MKPQMFALLTAIAWGVGGYFEKKGLHLGNLSPQMGITIRTAVAFVILAVISFPQLKSLPQAGSKALLYMVIGGGICCRGGGYALFLYRVKRRPTRASDANRFYIPVIRRNDGDHFCH